AHLVSSLRRMIAVGLLWFLGILSAGLIGLWLLAVIYGVMGSRFEYQRSSGARRYYFGVGGTYIYFVRFITYPQGGPSPANPNGVVSMGHSLESRSCFLGEWYH